MIWMATSDSDDGPESGSTQVEMFDNAKPEQWTSGDYQMWPCGDLSHNAKLFGEAVDETLKCDSQALLSDKYSLATSGVYIPSKAIYDALECDSLILQADKYSLVTYGGYIPSNGGLHMLVQLNQYRIVMESR